MTNLPICNLVELDVTGKGFLKNMLASGKELSKLILEQVDFLGGKLYTVLPPPIELDKLYNFNEGGRFKSCEANYSMSPYLMMEVGNTNHILTKLVYEFLKQTSQGICVFEDAMSLATDAVINNYPNQILTLGESVFYYLSAKEKADHKSIEKVIKTSNSLWHFLCIFTTVDYQIINEHVFNIYTLVELVNNIQAIIVGVYDGESYLIWSKHPKFLQFLWQQFP